ncbi:MAG: RNA-binding protein, partial [Candidatus Accumulibacter sp.]|nr:RNA-binding protein [Accumulibacter sp.]
MVNTQIFQTSRGQKLPRADTLNEAGGAAYALGPRHQLAQLAATGCLNRTFYADAETQLE